MPTLKAVIQAADALQPNAYTNDQKTAWLSELAAGIQTEVWQEDAASVTVYDYHADQDKNLIGLPPVYESLWGLWLRAQMDLWNGEPERYANARERFNAVYGAYVRWYARTADLEDGAAEEQGYCLSAYGIAVKHGYAGTEEEWLVTLKGAEGDSVDLRYENNVVQWQHEGDASWNDLINMKDIAGEMVTAMLGAAQSAQTAAEAAQGLAEAAKADAETAMSAAVNAMEAAVSAKTDAQTAKTQAVAAQTAAETAEANAEAAAALAVSVVNLTDKDDANKVYAMAWSVDNGFPVLTLTERT